VGIGSDITKQKQDEEKIIKLSKGIEQSSATIVITDINGIIEYVNPAFCKTTGYSEIEALGKNPRILKSGLMSSSIYQDLWKIISSGNVWRGELLNKRKDGNLFWEWTTITSIKNDKGNITNYIAIKDDITERKTLQTELVKAKEKAEESDHLKSAFLANMSHEIRTPLNSIIGFSELLADPDFDDDQKNEFIKTIIDNGNSLLVIISDIMDFSMLEARQMKIRTEIISTKMLLTELLIDFGKKADQRGIELRLDKSSQSPDVMMENDSYRIKQIFSNLIGNAIKFTHEGYIEIGYKFEAGWIEFHVKDTGIGIAPEFHQAIFDRFRQVDTAKTRKYGGNGLGLAISKNLVELLGGKIWVKSEPDKFSEFYFTIPIKEI
jgi:PAS domain S-box-containing protein